MKLHKLKEIMNQKPNTEQAISQIEKSLDECTHKRSVTDRKLQALSQELDDAQKSLTSKLFGNKKAEKINQQYKETKMIHQQLDLKCQSLQCDLKQNKAKLNEIILAEKEFDELLMQMIQLNSNTQNQYKQIQTIHWQLKEENQVKELIIQLVKAIDEIKNLIEEANNQRAWAGKYRRIMHGYSLRGYLNFMSIKLNVDIFEDNLQQLLQYKMNAHPDHKMLIQEIREASYNLYEEIEEESNDVCYDVEMKITHMKKDLNQMKSELIQSIKLAQDEIIVIKREAYERLGV